ncbi:MAG: hypothetical protein ACFFD4_04035 [Candidatus Odinarchaeota archaeon]
MCAGCSSLADALDHGFLDTGLSTDVSPHQFAGTRASEIEGVVPDSSDRLFSCRKKINHVSVDIEWEPSMYYQSGNEHRDPWSGEDLSAGFTHIFMAGPPGAVYPSPGDARGQLQRALKMGQAIAMQERYSLRQEKIMQISSLLSAYLPAGLFSDLLETFNRLNPGPCTLDKYIVIALAHVDLQLRLCRDDCLAPGLIEKVATDLEFEEVTRREVITIRKQLFSFMLETLDPETSRYFRKKYAASRNIENRKIGQLALEKIISLPETIEREKVSAAGRELLAAMKKKRYTIQDAVSFLEYFPLAACRAAGYEWQYLEDVLGASIIDLEHAAMNYLYRIGVKIKKVQEGRKQSLTNFEKQIMLDTSLLQLQPRSSVYQATSLTGGVECE